jgi:hypothetical protein
MGRKSMGMSKTKTGPSPRQRLHFLHIGKAAGSQIKELSKVINSSQTDLRIITHKHRFSLLKIKSGNPYFFSIRDPLTRFYSGFYSRKREGRPRNYKTWTPHEKIAFGHFDHANDLAEALFSDGLLGARAFAAMTSISHVCDDQVGWFSKRGQFLQNRPPVWIVRQEHFDADWAVFLDKIGCTLAEARPKSGTPLHANSYDKTPPLSEKARENLKRWYVQDIVFYAQCENWVAEQANMTGTRRLTRFLRIGT